MADRHPSYYDAVKEFFGGNLIFQLCLLHLNKRTLDDFPKNISCCKVGTRQFYEYRLRTQLCGVYRFSHREVYNF